MLDKTHLRFFTKKSIARLFKTAGYHTQFLGSHKVGNVVIADDLIGILTDAGIKAENLNEELNDFQYFVCASLGYNAFIIHARQINQLLLNKIFSLSAGLKRNIKIIVVYEFNTPIVEFINSLEDLQKSIVAVNVNEIEFDKYKSFIFINNSNFSLENLEDDFGNFTGETVIREAYTITGNNTAEFHKATDKLRQYDQPSGTDGFRPR